MEHVIETDEARFQDDVLERSKGVPVLVDFWAPWCGPCRYLTPVLEKLATEMAGAFVLAKVNTDENQLLASDYGISGIPNVKLFRDGRVVDEFVGALPESQVRTFLRPHCPSKGDHLLADARLKLAAGDAAGARALLERVLETEPESSGARVELARLALAAGDADGADGYLDAVTGASDDYELAQHLREGVKLARAGAEIGSAASVEERLARDSEDVEARYSRACLALAQGSYRAALEDLLAAVRADRKWNDEAARKAMVVVFYLVGVRDPLSDEFREKLARTFT